MPQFSAECAVPAEFRGKTVGLHFMGYVANPYAANLSVTFEEPGRGGEQVNEPTYGYNLYPGDNDDDPDRLVQTWTPYLAGGRFLDFTVPVDVPNAVVSMYLGNEAVNGSGPRLRIVGLWWVSLETGVEPPLRQRQRDDGLGLDTGHARLNSTNSITPNQPSSQQLGKGRLPERTYA